MIYLYTYIYHTKNNQMYIYIYLYTSPHGWAMDFPSPFCFKSAQDLSNLTATQRELLSDRKSWPEMPGRVQQKGNILGSRCHQYLCVKSKTLYKLSLVGEMIQFDKHIFQMGWNHQLGHFTVFWLSKSIVITFFQENLWHRCCTLNRRSRGLWKSPNSTQSVLERKRQTYPPEV